MRQSRADAQGCQGSRSKRGPYRRRGLPHMNRLQRFRVSTLAACVAVVVAFALQPVAAAQTDTATSKISVSYPEGGAHLPLFLARDTGIFAKYGLDVTLQGLGGGPVAMAALVGGDIQIADITGSEIVN